MRKPWTRQYTRGYLNDEIKSCTTPYSISTFGYTVIWHDIYYTCTLHIQRQSIKSTAYMTDMKS